MKKHTVCHTLVIVVLVVVGVVETAHAQTARHAVELVPMEAGDSSIQPVHVSITTDGTHLTAVFDAGHDIQAYLLGNQASSMAELWIDTDNDESTGGKPFFSDIGGFEYAAHRVYVCKGGDNGHVCAGDIGEMEFTTFYSSYSPQLWDAAADDFKDVYDAFWDEGKQDLDGSKATVVIPYSEMQCKPGQTVRLMVLSGTSSGNKFPVVTLQLK